MTRLARLNPTGNTAANLEVEAMMLTLDDAQLKQFDEEGWLFFEDVLTQTKLRSSIARPAGFSRWTARNISREGRDDRAYRLCSTEL